MESTPPPQFENRTQQLLWYVKEFAVFLNELHQMSGLDTLVFNTDNIDKVPPILLIGMITDIDERYGKSLLDGDMKALFRVLVEHSPFQNPMVISENAIKVVALVESDETLKKRLFRFIRIFTKILHS